VVHGDGRGRSIGFPTANIALPRDLLLPAYGVYAARVVVGGTTHNAVANIGLRPTVAAAAAHPSLEVHLFAMAQDIYGQRLSVQLVEYLRPEMRFPSIDVLKAQIASDCETAQIRLQRPHD
jgi:riboflavin kinase/FMN adenylyltransferase